MLEGSGVLEVEGEQHALSEGHAVFVPAGADHRFTAYEQLAVLVAFARGSAVKPQYLGGEAPTP